MSRRSKDSQGNTYQPSKIKRIRKFGFLKRSLSHHGVNVLKRRRSKGRKNLSVSEEFGSKMSKNKRFSRRR